MSRNENRIKYPPSQQAPVADGLTATGRVTNTAIPLAWLGLVVLVVAALGGIYVFVKEEKQQTLMSQESQLNIIVDSQQLAVERWLGKQYATMDELAQNGSLQLYLSQLTSDSGDEGGNGNTDQAQTDPLTAVDERGQSSEAVYLREILRIVGHKAGFIRDSLDTSLRIDSDPSLRKGAQRSGLALLDATGAVVVSSAGMARIDTTTRFAIERAIQAGGTELIDLAATPEGRPLLGFVTPVYGIQSSEGDAPVGFAVGIKPVDTELYPLLRNRGLGGRSHESYLVRAEGQRIRYLSPLADDTRPMSRLLSRNTQDLAAAYALANPGEFTEATDYAGTSVLMTSRNFDLAPWILVHKVDLDEAMASARRRQNEMLWVLLSLVAVLAISLIAAWKHGASVRYRQAAQSLSANNQALESQRALLRSVTDNISDLILILEPDMSFRFVNQALSRACGIAMHDFLGKSLSAILGPHVANEIGDTLEQHSDEVFSFTDTLSICENQAAFHISVARLEDGAVLMVLRDVSELLQAQQRANRMLYQLVQILVGVLDKHDPYTADHSRKVSQLAVALGESLSLTNRDLHSLRIAASLMNIGKITIPQEVLLKTTPLNIEELSLIRSHVESATEMLATVEFDGPVVKAIGQSCESMDGSGYPDQLEGEQIHPLARILAVANSFVAITNPRSYRNARSFADATNMLLADAGSKYDRKVVAALFSFIEEDAAKQWEREWQQTAEAA